MPGTSDRSWRAGLSRVPFYGSRQATSNEAMTKRPTLANCACALIFVGIGWLVVHPNYAGVTTFWLGAGLLTLDAILDRD